MLHLAAIPDPGGQPDEVVFSNNVLATVHVVQAAETLGIERVVWASSVCAVGAPYAPPRTAPRYSPLDEEHPLVPPDGYGLSKLMGEEICRAAARRSPLTTVSLRFSWVVYPDTYSAVVGRLDDRAGPDAATLWTYTDIRDAALACRLALSAPLTGHHAFFIVAPETLAVAGSSTTPNAGADQHRAGRAGAEVADHARVAQPVSASPAERGSVGSTRGQAGRSWPRRPSAQMTR